MVHRIAHRWTSRVSLYSMAVGTLPIASIPNPTVGTPFVMLWQEEKGSRIGVAAFGRATDWPILKRAEFKSRWPAGVDLAGDPSKNATLCVWSDLNLATGLRTG